MEWFTSDWHLAHENLRIRMNRPFANIQEMDEKIIENFFNVVKPGDRVYFIGDMTYDKTVAQAFFERKPRNIHFHFIMGNHDKKYLKYNFLKNYCETIDWLKEIKIKGQKITLCHYMMASWDCSHWNAWHIHGHHHNQEQSNHAIGKVLNVCVDLHNFEMISFDQVVEYMKTRPDNWDLIKE